MSWTLFNTSIIPYIGIQTKNLIIKHLLFDRVTHSVIEFLSQFRYPLKESFVIKVMKFRVRLLIFHLCLYKQLIINLIITEYRPKAFMLPTN